MTGTDGTARRTLVVAGNGMVGQRLVEALRAKDVDRAWRVVVFGEEPHPAYDRVALTSYFSGATLEELTLVPVGVLRRRPRPLAARRRDGRVGRPCCAHRHHRQRADDPLRRARAGHRISPVRATGAGHRPALVCFVYRTIDDLDRLRADVTQARVGAVVGGGLLGLEAADALRALGKRVHVVEVAPRLMPLQVDEGGGHALRRHIAALGAVVHTGAMTTRLEADQSGRVNRLILSDATEIDADVVVVAAGIRPRDELARGCDLEVGERGGVLVDRACRTSDPSVWAVGECAAVEGRVLGLVAPGYAMAEIVAEQLVGGYAELAGADLSTKLKLLGVDVASFGDVHATTEGALELVWSDPVAGIYQKLVVTDDARTLLGGVLVGDASDYAALRPLLGREIGCPTRAAASAPPRTDPARPASCPTTPRSAPATPSPRPTS